LNETPFQSEKVKAGSAIYSRFVLSIYDFWFLWYNCRFLWECPARFLLDLYNEYVSSNHLDIGVGTGYFLDKCQFPNTNIRLALMDLNPNSLRAASRRLYRYKPEVYQGNVLEPFGINAPSFNSIGMMNLLHCIPGDINTKAILFEHAKEVMNPGAVLFGSTILYEGIKRSARATFAIKYANKKGWMANMNDSLEDLQESLKGSFSDSSVKVIGCEALFWAHK
jgi:SAM-dependent methyltransferase